MPHDQAFLDQAVALIRENVEHAGRSFGAVLVRSGEALAQVPAKSFAGQSRAVEHRATLYGRWSSRHGQ